MVIQPSSIDRRLRACLLAALAFSVACSAGTTPSKGGDTGGAGNDGTGGAAPGAGGDGSGGDVGNGGEGAGGSATLPAFDAGSAADRNKVPRGQICERIATIQCAGEQHCCNAPGRSFDDCKAAQKNGCVDAYLDDVSADPNLSGYDAAAAEPIFARFEELAAACDTSVTAWGATARGLRGIMPGRVDPGGKCTPPPLNLSKPSRVVTYLSACKIGDPDGTQYACMPHPPVPVQEWTCVARSSGACFSDLNCNDGMYCDNPSANLAGSTCKSRKADGESCTLTNECSSLLCKQGRCATLDVQSAYCLEG